MYLHISLVLLLFAQCATAKHSSPSSYSITKRFHHAALRRSASLAADLRKAMGGVLVVRQAQTNISISGLQKRAVYCVSRPKSSDSGNSTDGTTIVSKTRPAGTARPPRPSGSATRSATGSPTSTSTGTGTSGPAATPSSTSSWALVESHASLVLCVSYKI